MRNVAVMPIVRGRTGRAAAQLHVPAAHDRHHRHVPHV